MLWTKSGPFSFCTSENNIYNTITVRSIFTKVCEGVLIHVHQISILINQNLLRILGKKPLKYDIALLLPLCICYSVICNYFFNIFFLIRGISDIITPYLSKEICIIIWCCKRFIYKYITFLKMLLHLYYLKVILSKSKDQEAIFQPIYISFCRHHSCMMIVIKYRNVTNQGIFVLSPVDTNCSKLNKFDNLETNGQFLIMIKYNASFTILKRKMAIF